MCGIRLLQLDQYRIANAVAMEPAHGLQVRFQRVTLSCLDISDPLVERLACDLVKGGVKV